MTAAELARVHAAAFTVPRPWTAAEFATLLAAQGTLLISAEAGFALARVIADEAEILTIAVAPPLRRQGLASRLLAGVLAEAAARGATTAFLEVAADNAAARALYRSAGFAEAGRRAGYYGAGDALILRKPL